MKIQTQLSQENISDTLSLSGNILNINGKDYPLDNLKSPVIATEENPEPDNPQFFIDNPVYCENGIDQLKIYHDNKHQFDFINNNYKLFFDLDLNGDIDMIELKKMIDHYNLSEEDRKVNRLAIKNSFSKKEWEARRKACGQLK